MILFVGDSITHGNNWPRYIDFVEVSNIAVPGFTTDDVANQIKEIIQLEPRLKEYITEPK